MPIPPHLVELRSRLEAAGMVVVEEPDCLTVRLPFFCSVRVYSDGTRLRFDSYFGIVSRVRSTTLKLGGITLLAFASAHYGLGYAGMVALLGVISGIYDGIRWQVTEHAITRIATINAIAAAQSPAAYRALDQTSNPALRSGTSPIMSDAGREMVHDRHRDTR